jgi:DNA-binding transcriptional MocR family regulator
MRTRLRAVDPGRGPICSERLPDGLCQTRWSLLTRLSILPSSCAIIRSGWRSPQSADVSEKVRPQEGLIVSCFHPCECHDYERRPLGSLQGLDTQGRIVYVGTFSLTVFPALRIGYLIVPKSLAPAFTAAKWLSDLHSATLEQQSLAEFITTGMYERHLRRLRRRNTARRETLLHAIRAHLGDRVEVTGDGSGAHVVLWPRKRLPEDTVIAPAASRGVGIYGICRFFLTRPSRTGLMLGYSRMHEKEIREGIRLLGETL